MRASAVRTLVAECPDWPVVAAGIGADEPVVVVDGAGRGGNQGRGGRVVACSAAARAQGVRRGQRRREVEGCCPGAEVLVADADREARAFEVVAAAVGTLTSRLEVVRPGILALPTRGPSRYFGGDAALAERVAARAEEALERRGRCRVGVADGLFAALVAARRGAVVEPGRTATFLAPLPVAALHHIVAARGTVPPSELVELVELLRRLGLRTLGDVAGVAPADLSGRFGPAGIEVSRLCRGLDDRPLRPRVPPPDLTVSAELDPPATRIEAAAFVARTLAAELAGRLGARGLACTRVGIEAETEHGETLSRRWRTEGLPLATALVERVRWQLEGWCNGSGVVRPTGGISVLRLVPEELAADRGRQRGFWGEATAGDERAARVVARLQGVLGPEAVAVPRRRGGRAPGDQVSLVAAAGLIGEDSAGGGSGPETGAPAPWPGRLPAPSPALVHDTAVPAEVIDDGGEPVVVTGRGLATARPSRISLAGGPWADVVAWAGPWPVDERWWDETSRCRRARVQVVTTGGEAHLLALRRGRWVVEATYD